MSQREILNRRWSEVVRALDDITQVYEATDHDRVEKPLSGADVVDEVSDWIERYRDLLHELGVR